MNTENATSNEATLATTLTTETPQVSLQTRLQREIERRLAIAKLSIAADVEREELETEAQKLLSKNPLVRDVMTALHSKPKALVDFIFSNARVSISSVESQETPQSRKEGSSASDNSAGNAALSEEQILVVLRKQTAPISIGNVAKALFADTEDVRPFLKALLEAGKVSKEGNKRATVYTLLPETAAVVPPPQDTAPVEASSTPTEATNEVQVVTPLADQTDLLLCSGTNPEFLGDSSVNPVQELTNDVNASDELDSSVF